MSHGPSKMLLICSFALICCSRNIIIVNAENSCAAQSFGGKHLFLLIIKGLFDE